MAAGLGAISAQSSVRRWQMDDVTFTYIVDGSMTMAPSSFFPAIPADHWDAHPEELDARHRVAMSTGGLLVERGEDCLLIDTGFGPVTANSAVGEVDCGALPQTLAAVGVTAGDIKVVALTHLHIDHTGWLFTSTRDGESAPTFRDAAYVVSEPEWAPYTRGRGPAETADHGVVELLRRHPRLSTIRDGQEIAPGITALVTPGHSTGHTSYIVASQTGRRLIAFGDAFHAPAQLRHPQWGSGPDADPAAVPSARRRIITELLEPETYAFAVHFGDQPFGRVRGDVDNTLGWHPMSTEVLAPPPRAA